jgi:adenylate cyclase
MSALRPPGKATHPVAAGLVALILIAGVAVCYWLGVFETLELRSYDLRFNIRGPRPPRDDILLVTIDQNTVRDLGCKTTAITRAMHAQVISNLARRGARLIVYDMDFSSPASIEQAEDDYMLQQTLADSGVVIMARYISQGDWVRPHKMFRSAPVVVEGAVQKWTQEGIPNEHGNIIVLWVPASNADVDGFWIFASTRPITDPYAQGVIELGQVPERDHYFEVTGLDPDTIYHFLVLGYQEMPLLAGEGAINEVEDRDDRIRRKPLLVGVDLDDEKVPTLSFAAALSALWPQTQPEDCSEKADEVCLRGAGKQIRIPLVDGYFLVNFIGARDSFPRLSYSKVLMEEPQVRPPADLAGKIVLVGNTHPTAHDEYPTPFGRSPLNAADSGQGQTRFGYTPGLEIQANALQTILDQEFIRVQEPLQAVGMILIAGVIISLIFILVRAFSIPGIIVLIASMAGAAVASQYLFETRNYWLVTTPLLMTVGLNFIGILLVQTVGEYREKQFIKGAFGMYLAPAVIDHLIKEPDKLALGGEEREMTALFSDVQSFSSISEMLKPTELVHLLNEYLTAMSDALFEFEGTVDKFEGDAIIAFFGAPLPCDDHALRACGAALTMQRKNAELNEKLEKEGWPPLVTRIGINTGRMVVGNMGSAQRMDYTIMGDSVNLASRLEGANKQYGSLVMISEFTYEQVKEKLESRELDMITVVGKEKPVRVYELLANRGEMDENTAQAVEAFAQGLSLYRVQKWDEAIARFEEAIRIRGQDRPSQVYIQRCQEFKANPPPPDWGGLFRLKLK